MGQAGGSGWRRWRGVARTAFRLAVFVLVAWGIARAAMRGVAEYRAKQAALVQQQAALEDALASLGPEAAGEAAGRRAALERQLERLRAERFSLRRLSPEWLAAAGALYLAGSAPCWWFWRRTLQLLGQQPGSLASLRAYYIGHLGKYVPGKAMVVVLRSSLIQGPRVDATVAGAAVFVETLTMMAVGAFVAGLILAVRAKDDPRLLALAVLLLGAAGAPTAPPVFRRLIRWLRLRRVSPQIEEAADRFRLGFLAAGWLPIAAGWLLMGASLWAVLRAMPAMAPSGPLWAVWPQLTACVALALVAGFLSLLPGGVGVREYVVTALLAPSLGEAAALLAAVLLRLVWLVSELAFSGILYVTIHPPPGRRAAEG